MTTAFSLAGAVSPADESARESETMVYHDIKPIQTHWPDCWRDPSHHACAVARVEQLKRQLAERDEKLEAAFHKEQERYQEREDLRQELRECREALAVARAERDREAMAATDYKAEMEHQQRERAAAEAREQVCIQLLEELYNKAHQYGPEFELLGIADDALYRAERAATGSHTALHAALEQRTIFALREAASQLRKSDDTALDQSGWTEAEIDALCAVIEKHNAALEQARHQQMHTDTCSYCSLLPEHAKHCRYCGRPMDDQGEPRYSKLEEQALAEERERQAEICNALEHLLSVSDKMYGVATETWRKAVRKARKAIREADDE